MKTHSIVSHAAFAFSLVSLALLLPMVESAHAASFTPTGFLSRDRYYHTATLMPNGQVLVAGGYQRTDDLWLGPLDSVEMYDPAAGTWAGLYSMGQVRTLHTATLLPNGNLLVAGGWGDDEAAAEIYYPAYGIWWPTAAMAYGRKDHTATLLLSGQALVVGGYGVDPAALYTPELYNPSTATWSAAGSLATGRYSHTATLLANGKVLIVGGQQDFSGTALASAELYDPSTGWTTTYSMANARYRHTATLLPNGKVLVAGGYNSTGGYLASAELYDPDSGWTTTTSLTTARNQHTATLLPNGKVLVAGGIGAGNLILFSAELYEPWSGAWSSTVSMDMLRARHTATLLPDGKVLVAAGYASGGPLGDGSSITNAELYETSEAHTISWLFPIQYQNQDYLGAQADRSTGSGVTYWPGRDTYLLLDNTVTARLLEYSRSHVLQRIISLSGFQDPEDVHWISGNTFVIAQEYNVNPNPDSMDELVVINVPTSGTSLNISAATRRLQINTATFTSASNNGIEGVALIGSDFYFTTERAPTSPANSWKVWRVPNTGSGIVSVTPTGLFSLPSLVANRATDISGMATDGAYLWLLSHEGVGPGLRGRLLIMSVDGRLVGDNLLPNFTGGGTWQQAEGIELFTDPIDGKMKILLTGEVGGGTGVDFMLLSE